MVETTATASPVTPRPPMANDGRIDCCASAGRTRTASESTTMPASKPDERESARVTASGVQASGPTGTPQMRETAHTPMIPALSNTPAVSSRRVGRRMTPTAHAICSHATTAKNVPCIHETS